MKNILTLYRQISRNKNVEFQIFTSMIWFKPYLWTELTVNDDTTILKAGLSLFCDIIGIGMEWTRKTDHAGFEIRIALLGLHIDFNVYDGRHWDHLNDRWVNYDNIPE